MVSNKRNMPISGYCYGVPLRDCKGFGVCLVVSANKGGVCFGYFFNSKFDSTPSINNTEQIKLSNTAFSRWFGDFEIINGNWPSIGILKDFDLNKWSLPTFSRIDVVKNTALEVKYNLQGQIIEEKPISLALAKKLSSEGLLGAGAAELLLTSLLCVNAHTKAR